jgi:hypothetical protein
MFYHAASNLDWLASTRTGLLGLPPNDVSLRHGKCHGIREIIDDCSLDLMQNALVTALVKPTGTWNVVPVCETKIPRPSYAYLSELRPLAKDIQLYLCNVETRVTSLARVTIWVKPKPRFSYLRWFGLIHTAQRCNGGLVIYLSMWFCPNARNN